VVERVEVALLYCGQGMANWIEYYATDTQWADKTPAMLVLVDLGGDGINSDLAPKYVATRIAEIKAKTGATPSIRAAVFSHQDSDHWSLIKTFLAALKTKGITDLKIELIWRGGKLWKQGALDAVELLRAATKSKVREFPDNSTDYEGHQDSIADEGDCSVRLVIANGPCKLKSGGMMENGTSAVIAVEMPGNAVILPGDATWETMDFINEVYEDEDQPPPCYGLSVPHHGSLRTSVKGYTKKKKVEKMGWQFVDTFVDNIEAKQVGASAGFENSHEHPMIEIIERFEKYAVSPVAEHYLQVFNFTDQEWQKPARKTTVWTTTYFVKKPPPPVDPNNKSKKRKPSSDQDEFEVAYGRIHFTMDGSGLASVQRIREHDVGSPAPAQVRVAAPPTPEELAAHAARSSDAAR
jgi:hypothetical protein